MSVFDEPHGGEIDSGFQPLDVCIHVRTEIMCWHGDWGVRPTGAR